MPKLVEKEFTFIGIDPGASGGIACITGGTGKLQVELISTPSTLTELWSVFEQLSEVNTLCTAVIEKVHAMPSQGVTSMFSFGMRKGELLMALTAAGIPFEEVSPQTWQKEFKIVPKKKTENKVAFKTRILSTAHRLFPHVPLWKEPRSKGKQLAVCDALLLAEFCRRKFK